MRASTLFLAAALWTAVDPSLERKSTRAPPLTSDITMRVGPDEAEEEEEEEEDLEEEEEEGRRLAERHSGVSADTEENT